jgi:hypothetical protein
MALFGLVWRYMAVVVWHGACSGQWAWPTGRRVPVSCYLATSVTSIYAFDYCRLGNLACTQNLYIVLYLFCACWRVRLGLVADTTDVKICVMSCTARFLIQNKRNRHTCRSRLVRTALVTRQFHKKFKFNYLLNFGLRLSSFCLLTTKIRGEFCYVVSLN